MPYLKIQTNLELGADAASALAAEASRTTARALGKPERYVMVAVQPGTTMAFGGDAGPLAYLELKSIGLDESATPQLSQTLCRMIADQLAITPERVYIEFADAPRAMWGWNGATF